MHSAEYVTQVGSTILCCTECAAACSAAVNTAVEHMPEQKNTVTALHNMQIKTETHRSVALLEKG